VAAAVPREIGCSGVTAWRRLRDWQATGVWDRLHHELLRRLNAAGRIDWSRGVVDSSHIRALQRGLTGPSAVDRGGPGSKHQLIVDASGVSLAASLTGGNRNDVTQLLPLVGAIGPVAGSAAGPPAPPPHRRRPRLQPRQLPPPALAPGIKPIIARRGTEHGSGLGKWRWVVDRTFAWLHNCRRLLIRWERDPIIHTAFLTLACALLCWGLLGA
jgi:transposase